MKEDDLNRLFLLRLEMQPELADEGEIGLEKIQNYFKSLRLNIICSDEVANSIPYQAALLTAINSGKRCFLGGVNVKLKDDRVCLLPRWKNILLSKVISEVGGQIVSEVDEEYYSLTIGNSPVNSKSFQLVCNDWIGGVVVQGDNEINLKGNNNFPFGGILSACIGVGLSFLHATGISQDAFNRSKGISLWRPDLIDNWYCKEAYGPPIENFPKKLWLLGLGHLGQAYSWAIGLIDFSRACDLSVFLHDPDLISKANYSAGLLAEERLVGKYKTRVAAQWLEDRGIKTRICESYYGENTFSSIDDPEILLGGLDSLKTRKLLKSNEFKLLVDCGIGGTVGTFDLIRVNTFPNNETTPSELWNSAVNELEMPATKRLTEKLNGCGYVKGISTSFVGGFSSCFVLSEVLRAYQKGVKTSYMNMSIRDFENRRVKVVGNYSLSELETEFINL